MTASDRELRSAWAGLADRSATPPDHGTSGCPTDEQIFEALDRNSALTQRQRIVDHLADCPRCAESWRVASAVRGDRPVPTARSPMRTSRSWLPLAAVIAVGAITFMLTLRNAPDSELRSIAAMRIESLLADRAPLPRDRFLLAWSAGPKGSTYDLLVGTAPFRTLAHAMLLAEPRFQVSQGALAELPSGAEVTWRVQATLPDGTTVSSVTFRNNLK